MQVRVLGSLEILDDDGRPLDLGGAQPRVLVAALLAPAGRHGTAVVSTEALIDAVWGEQPPASALGTLQSYVSRLRQALEPGRGPRDPAQVLVREPPGYRLAVDPDAIDFVRFERLADEGRSLLAAGDAARALEALADADRLWRGPAFVEHRDADFARTTVVRLEERRRAATEDRIAAELALGRHTAVIGELTGLVAAEPLQEGLRAHLALALYRAGRQAEALRALDDARRTLRDELGVDPGRALRDLEAAILAQDPALELRAPTATASSVALDAPAGAPPATAATTVTEEDPSAPAGDRLIGRTGELAVLRRALDESRRATRAVIVEGEPGIGKTRLVEELAAEAERAGVLVLWGRAFEGGASPAYWPWLPALRALVASLGSADVAAPELEALLAPAATGGPSAVGPGSAEQTRFALFDGAVRVLEAASAPQPVMIVLDDLQWADEASLELLAQLPSRLTRARLLLVATIRELDVGRNDAVVAALAALTRSTGARRITLRGLGPQESALLVAQVAGAALDPAVVDQLDAVYERAEGNPFFTAELARLLAEGAIDDVPSGVRDVVRRRLDPLPPETRSVLQVAAVVGRDADLTLLSSAAGLDIGACLDALEPAVVQRFVAPVDERPGTYRFVHALVREVIADDLTSLQRARLHVRVADALGDRDDDTAEIVAEHLWAATSIGVAGRAAAALERAAHVAIRRIAYARAEDLLERAVELYRTAATADATAELRALSLLASVVGAHHGYAAFVDSPIIDRAKQLGAHRSTAVEAATLVWAEWAGFDTTCHFSRADPIAHDLLAMAEASDSALIQALGHTAYGISSWHRGRLRESAEHLAAARETARRVPPDAMPSTLFDTDQLRLSGPFLTYVRDLLGELDQPEASYRAIEDELPGDRYWGLIVSNFAASSALTVGDARRADRAARRGLMLDPDGISGFWSTALRAYLGAAMCLVGDLDEGIAVFDDGWARYTASGQRTNGPTMLASKALGLANGRRIDDAAATARLARTELDTWGERYAEPVVLMTEAVVAHARDEDPATVVALLHEALAVAESQEARATAARVRATAAHLGVDPRAG